MSHDMADCLSHDAWQGAQKRIIAFITIKMTKIWHITVYNIVYDTLLYGSLTHHGPQQWVARPLIGWSTLNAIDKMATSTFSTCSIQYFSFGFIWLNRT